MGEYADDAIERDFNSYTDFMTRTGIYEDMDYLDIWEGEDIPVFHIRTFVILKVDKILRETEKAWFLSTEKYQAWFSKKYCRLKKNKIIVPNWLLNKMDKI